MKIQKLRRIYPSIKSYTKNIKWRALSDRELDKFMQAKQITSNCYDNSVRYVLLNNSKGREILKKCFKIQGNKSSLEPAYKASFNIKGQKRTFRCTISDYYGKFMKYYADFYGGIKNFLNTYQTRVTPEIGISILISKMISKFPNQKPFLSRLYEFPYHKVRNYEHNKISNAFRWYTGREPISYGENEISLNLTKYSSEVKDLLNGYNPENDCLVVMTNNRKFKDIDSWHCVPVINTDKNAQTLTIINKRNNETLTLTYDELIKNFKAIVGIKNL